MACTLACLQYKIYVDSSTADVQNHTSYDTEKPSFPLTTMCKMCRRTSRTVLAKRWSRLAYKDGVEGAVEGVEDGGAEWFSNAAEAVEDEVSGAVDYVVGAPEAAVRAVGEVEHFGQDAGDAVTQASEDLAREIGNGVDDVQEAGEDVQRHGDSLDEAHQQGRGEKRYD